MERRPFLKASAAVGMTSLVGCSQSQSFESETILDASWSDLLNTTTVNLSSDDLIMFDSTTETGPSLFMLYHTDQAIFTTLTNANIGSDQRRLYVVPRDGEYGVTGMFADFSDLYFHRGQPPSDDLKAGGGYKPIPANETYNVKIETVNSESRDRGPGGDPCCGFKHYEEFNDPVSNFESFFSRLDGRPGTRNIYLFRDAGSWEGKSVGEIEDVGVSRGSLSLSYMVIFVLNAALSRLSASQSEIESMKKQLEEAQRTPRALTALKYSAIYGERDLSYMISLASRGIAWAITSGIGSSNEIIADRIAERIERGLLNVVSAHLGTISVKSRNDFEIEWILEFTAEINLSDVEDHLPSTAPAEFTVRGSLPVRDDVELAGDIFPDFAGHSYNPLLDELDISISE